MCICLLQVPFRHNIAAVHIHCFEITMRKKRRETVYLGEITIARGFPESQHNSHLLPVPHSIHGIRAKKSWLFVGQHRSVGQLSNYVFLSTFPQVFQSCITGMSSFMFMECIVILFHLRLNSLWASINSNIEKQFVRSIN